ncbi:peptidylprolyl isomerase [Erysipelothrix sp. HDW6B]|uniref:peptidylprolyl isomerase n=1 Tax=Erysipelothrix TaxID=1647 RepID=UPI00135C6FB9|nr:MULTISPECIES: peptidylprolyl isomerase [Erysipelothrix]QIK85992.1 peptidylprolyl isomerase [Erysipelothrix sp. HDW6B]
MIDNLKKYWFVVVICLVLVAGIGFYAKQQIGTVLRGKTVEGKQVVSEIAGVNYFAEDYNKDLKERYGLTQTYALFERSVLSSIETTPEIAKKSKEIAETAKAGTAQQQGQAGMQQLESYVISLGYKGLDELNIVYEDMAKRDQIILDYVNANKETYLDPYVEASSPRMVSHILIKMTDSKNPTAEEQAKIDKVNAQLAEGKPFNEVAMALSDDTASAQRGGSIGFTDKSSQLVPEFLAAALATEAGQTSEWTASQYGMHLIKVDSTNPEDFVSNDEEKAKYIASLTASNKQIVYNAIWDKAKDLDIKFTDDAVKKELLTLMGIEEGQ